MKKYISIIIAVSLIAASVFIAILFIKNKDKKKPKVSKATKMVVVTIVKNKTIPIEITATGSLIAKNKIEIYSEVQGVLNILRKDFKAGTKFAKGETLLSINTDEARSNLQALKSSFHNALIVMMPDIKVDFASEYEKWQNYLSAFEMDKSLAKLPKANSEREKFFITGKNIYTQYYNVKKLEIGMRKYTIKAPYSGVLTEALVTQGSLIRQGQKLGEFINSNAYEVELAINSSFIDFLQIGNPVTLNNLEQSKSWQAKIVRINGKIDQTTQTVRVFVEVTANDLREGMYVEANLQARSETNVFEVDRKLLFDKNKLFAVEDSALYAVKVIPVHFNEKTVVVKGLADGMKLLSKLVPGAYEGMKVKTN